MSDSKSRCEELFDRIKEKGESEIDLYNYPQKLDRVLRWKLS